MITLVDVLKRTHQFLDERGVPSPRMEAELLLGHALGLDRVQLYMSHQRPLDETELTAIRALVARRAKREPLHWILGSRGFHDIELQLVPGVLVPRPDTEALVEAVLKAMAEGAESLEGSGGTEAEYEVVLDEEAGKPRVRSLKEIAAEEGEYRVEPVAEVHGSEEPEGLEETPVEAPPPKAAVEADAAEPATQGTAALYIADVGCGSGAVGLALAHALPEARVYCTDIAAEALDCTRRNVAALGLEARVAVLEGPLLSPIPARRPIDWVVSNPPYIPSAELDALEPEVARWEPRLALDGGRDGLAVYRELVPQAARRARVGVAVEIGHDQGPAVRRIFEGAGLTGVTVSKDLGGRDRVVLGWTDKNRAPGR